MTPELHKAAVQIAEVPGRIGPSRAYTNESLCPRGTPELYLRFEEDRTHPSHDLAARVCAERVNTIIDLNAGQTSFFRGLLCVEPRAREQFTLSLF